jgi:antirestriction protein ArdC
MNRDIYEAITERFIEQLKRGTVRGRSPGWVCKTSFRANRTTESMPGFSARRTINPRSGSVLGRRSTLSGHVKKGEKSTPVIFYKILEKRDESGKVVLHEDGRPARIQFLRWANVFNLDQTEGISAPTIDQDGDGVSNLLEWKHGTRPTDRLPKPRGHSL